MADPFDPDDVGLELNELTQLHGTLDKTPDRQQYGLLATYIVSANLALKYGDIEHAHRCIEEAARTLGWLAPRFEPGIWPSRFVLGIRENQRDAEPDA